MAQGFTRRLPDELLNTIGLATLSPLQIKTTIYTGRSESRLTGQTQIFPTDNTIPQATEGKGPKNSVDFGEFALTMIPSSTSTRIRVFVWAAISHQGTSDYVTLCVFNKDVNATNALGAGTVHHVGNNGAIRTIHFAIDVQSPASGVTTKFVVRYGTGTGGAPGNINENSSIYDIYGGVISSGIIGMEYIP